jgi:hypothetical protein
LFLSLSQSLSLSLPIYLSHSSSFFAAKLSEDDKQHLVSVMRKINFSANHVIFKAGDKSDQVYVLAQVSTYDKPFYSPDFYLFVIFQYLVERTFLKKL